MNKLWFLLLVAVNLLHANVTEVKDPYKEIDYFVLENGLQVYMLSNDKATNTNISMKINVGWDIEDEESYGLSHLVEHMVFRDKRVPYRDYLDYMQDEGASYVNGFTSRYKTELIVKIDSNKSYWIVETFAKMIFDKDVDNEDIEIEKGAVQVEIGEKVWYESILTPLLKIKKIAPPKESIYQSHFGLVKAKELPTSTVEKDNNKNFTLEEVMTHYKKYYYPSNMILKITGNFNNIQMKELVQNTYGKIHNKGTQRTHKPKRDAILSKKEYIYYREGLDKNYGYIGTQYLFDDCQKHIILYSFIKYVSKKIQQKLRNKEGKSYTVSTHGLQLRGAGVVSISFDGLHDDFSDNIKLVKRSIKYYVENIDDEMIEEALEEYKKRYTSVEFDSDSLTTLVNKSEHMRSDHKINIQTHYDFFKSITPEKFKEVLAQVFIPENSYTVIYRDYYLFPGDISILGFLVLFIIMFIYFRFSYLIFSFRGIRYAKREVLLLHRIGNRFIGFVVFILLVFLTGLLYSWIEYFIMKYMVGDANYLTTLDIPYGLYMDIIGNVLHIILMFILFRWLVKYHSRIDVTLDTIYILGSNPMSISKSDVLSMDVVPWNIRKYFQIIGFSFFFWRPLLLVKTSSKTYYVRTRNAEELKEDILHRWMDRD
jgi:predicted Zn-dependent peptidase